jgi:transcriptional regulator with XRE-family HTH domain
MARGGGRGKTPECVKTLLISVIKEKGVRRVAADLQLWPSAVHRYSQGIGEPTTETLEKLSQYFDVSVSRLRGEETPLDILENISNEEMFHFCIKLGFQGGEQAVIDELTSRGFDENTAKHFIDVLKKSFSPDVLAKNWKTSSEDEIINPIVQNIYSCMMMDKAVSIEWFESAMLEAGKQINEEVIKPFLNLVLDLPAQDIISIAAIVKQFVSNDKFKNDVKQLLNNSIAHGK